MPLEIKPAKGGSSTLYLRIPRDVIKMYGIDQCTNFTFELLENNGGLKLMYKIQKTSGNKKLNYGEKL